MPSNKQTLKDLFVNDPEMLRILELREQTELLREMAAKKLSLEGIAQIKGDKGDKGDTGERGPEGPKGEKGDKGEDSMVPGPRGERGMPGRDGKDGKDGKDGTSVSVKEVKSLLSKILEDFDITEMGAISEEVLDKKLDKHSKTLTNTFNSRISNLRDMVERNYGGHGGSGGGSPSMVYDLSSQLDGVKTSFTIPANTAIIGVFGSSAPFIFAPTTDYTGTGTTTLSFTAGVDPSSALAAGQTLIVQYY